MLQQPASSIVGTECRNVLIALPRLALPRPLALLLPQLSSDFSAARFQETKGVTVELAEYRGGAITVKVPLMKISDAQARDHHTNSIDSCVRFGLQEELRLAAT